MSKKLSAIIFLGIISLGCLFRSTGYDKYVLNNNEELTKKLIIQDNYDKAMLSKCHDENIKN